MTANINKLSEENKRILFVAANPSVSTVTQWPVGFWWAELTHPYQELTEAGYEVEIRSPAGGALEADGFSDPEHESGYSAHDILSLGFKKSPSHAALIADTKSIADVSPDRYDGIFLVGGQSPMFTFVDNQELQQLVARFYEAGKVTAVLCHATSILLKTELSSGELLVTGKTWTGFADAEEKIADEFVGQKLQPFWIESEARALADTNFVVGPAFRELAIRDGNLITGQQQYSGRAVARLVLEALGR